MKQAIRGFGIGRTFGLLYVANFILALHLYLVTYINSNFLATFIAERHVGFVWIAGSVLGIAALLLVASLALSRFGNYRVAIALIAAEFFIFAAIAATGIFPAIATTHVVIPLFVLSFSVAPVMLFTLDVFLENFTTDEGSTGRVRGMFLTVSNVALIIAPLFAGLILSGDNYWKVYAVSAVLLVPLLYLISKFRFFKDPAYRALTVFSTIRFIVQSRQTYNIFMAQFLMRFFFAWMVIYTPLYLHNHIGFDWTTIGIMFSIMLLPYVLLEYPAGMLADTRFGEKEILAAGFGITALFTAIMSFITVPNVILWGAVLFMTRAGASLIEITSESYFFKHIKGDDNNVISFFRMLYPATYIAGATVGALALSVLDFRYIFFVLGAILLLGIWYALALEDTR